MNRLMIHTCKNCHHNYKGNFCTECGQKNTVTAFTFKHIFQEAFHAFTHTDKGFLVLVKKLLLNPGQVAYEYIVEGKRKKYYNLFTFFVVATAIAAFIESKELAIKETIFHENNEYGHIFNIYSKLLSFVTIPLLGFVIWVFNYSKKSLRYSEYTVLAMIMMSVKSLFDIVVLSINYFITAVFKVYTDLDENLLYAFLLILFFAYTNYNFHKKINPNPWLSSILTGIGFCIIQIAIAMFVIWAVLRNFNGLGIFNMYGIRISTN
ncbi:DUF3667 domain-containing protein [Ferruginibacter sp.]